MCVTICYFHSTIADVDYVTLVENVIFNGDENSRIVSVDIMDDGIFEGDEQFEVFLKTLPESPDVILGDPNIATGTILDDERPSKIFSFLVKLYILIYNVQYVYMFPYTVQT